MMADTIATVTDERVQRRVLDAIARHLEMDDPRDLRRLHELEVVGNGAGAWMVTPSEVETWLVTDLRGPVTRIRRHLGIGTVAESWRNGFMTTMTLVAR
jgi:hypothetical protein